MARFTVKDARHPGWQVAKNLADLLNSDFKRLYFSVYVDYPSTTQYPQPKEEAYFIVAKHPLTNELRFRRRITLNELMTEEGYQLLVAQLYLVEPPT